MSESGSSKKRKSAVLTDVPSTKLAGNIGHNLVHLKKSAIQAQVIPESYILVSKKEVANYSKSCEPSVVLPHQAQLPVNRHLRLTRKPAVGIRVKQELDGFTKKEKASCNKKDRALHSTSVFLPGQRRRLNRIVVCCEPCFHGLHSHLDASLLSVSYAHFLLWSIVSLPWLV